MRNDSAEVFDFAGFTLDRPAAELRRADVVVEVEPQVFDLIAFLAARAGRLVTREELVDAVWQGRVISDSTISSRVNSARKALGDDGRSQAIIRTIRGRGFRFETQTQRRASPPAREAGVGSTPDTPLELPDKPSVAVLPFVAHSRDEAHELFADGLTEEVIIGLSRLRALFVIARNSSFSYKNKPQDTGAISRDLGVRYLVVGGVRFARERVRVSAQLVDSTTGRETWSDTIDRRMRDTLVVQEDLARSVVSSVHTQVLLNEGEISEQKSRARQRVSDLLNRAWRSTAEWTPEGLSSAQSLATEALEKDPHNPRAHMIMALAHYGQAYLGYVDQWQEHCETGRAAAREAVRLAPNDEYAHWILACCSFCLREHEQAANHARRAVEISPNFSWAHGTMGTALAWSGRGEDAIRWTETALRYNPRDSTVYFRYLVMSLSHFGLERYESALEYASRVVNCKPDWDLGHGFKAASLVLLGRRNRASQAVRDALVFVSRPSPRRLENLPFSMDRMRGRFVRALLDAGFVEETGLR